VICSFPPVSAPDARILILGSMPGAASLAAGQYYAHPQNRFWPLMGELLGAGRELPYEARLARLKEKGIALWDVLAQCEREGSLDSAIRAECANDFAAFFAAHPQIARICFNGRKAADSFRRFVPRESAGADVPLLILPSTSPANASVPYAEKRAAWAAALAG
jgi:hypoxanthine-DNA glycosylase